MRYIFCFFITLVLFHSCSQNEASKNSVLVSGANSVSYNDSTSASYTESNVEKRDTLMLDFNDFVIKFPLLNTFSNNEIVLKDTTELYLDLESELDTFLIYWKNESIISYSIQEQYLTVLSLQDEGPHVELYDWKNYTSPWSKVDSVFKGAYLVKKISKNEASQFPAFTKQELISYLASNVSEDWAHKISNPETGHWTDKFWIGVGIRRILIRLILSNGQQITKMLVVYPPMGC